MTDPHRKDIADAGVRQLFDIEGIQVSAGSTPEAQQLLADARTHRVRPLCLCVAGGVPIYVARVGDRFIVKRMPDSGMVHATDCPSYLPPEALSGLGQVLGGAIIEQTDTGFTALRLGFRMAKTDRNGPAPAAGSGDGSDSVTADGARLGMRAVLHYLWQEGDLATWSPAMAGKRNWRVVSCTCVRPLVESSPEASRCPAGCSFPSRSAPTTRPTSPHAGWPRGRPLAPRDAPASS